MPPRFSPTVLGVLRAPAIDSHSLGCRLPGDQALSLGVISTAVACPMFGMCVWGGGAYLYPTTDAYPRTLWKVGATSSLDSSSCHSVF